MKQFLFLSGEFSSTLSLCMRQKERWDHTVTASKLSVIDGKVCKFNKKYDGVIWYCSTEDDELAVENLKTIIDSGVPCWPNPKWLLEVIDRFQNIEKLRMEHKELVAHIFTGKASDVYRSGLELEYPRVVKIGNQHSGIGKHKLSTEAEYVDFFNQVDDDTICSIEPFFEGASYRIFVGGKFGSERTVCLRYDNDVDWIKNAPGCNVVEDDSLLNDDILESAINIHRHMNQVVKVNEASNMTKIDQGTLLSGIDYVVTSDGNWNFLEYNHFPGLAMNEKIEQIGLQVFQDAISSLENK